MTLAAGPPGPDPLAPWPTGAPLHLRGTVLPDGALRDVFVVDGRFSATPVAGARTVLDGGYLLPGLVDAHAHLALASPAGDAAPAAERVRASALAQLEAGVLAVREPGGPDRSSRGIGPGEGLPRVTTAGRFLAAPGRYFPGLAREVAAGELAVAAAEEAAASGGWCKVIADFLGPGGLPVPSYPASALAEAAELVHAAGGRLAAHATCPESIEAVLAAGFDAVEHGTMLGADQVDRLAASAAIWVPTLLIGEGVLRAVQGFGGDGAAVARMRRALDELPAVVAAAAERGVRVLAGTDAGMGPHGRVADEIELLLRAGLSPEQALAAGSWAARDHLGLPGIEPGAPADLVAYLDDPRRDVAVLRDPALVLLDGRIRRERPGLR